MYVHCDWTAVGLERQSDRTVTVVSSGQTVVTETSVCVVVELTNLLDLSYNKYCTNV